MKPHRVIGVVVTVCVIAVASWYGPPAGSKTTDTSDLWWIHTESGWGIQLVQESNTIFATLFVYGPDGQPTWYASTMSYLGSFNWSGTLYKTTGPWFGAASFDPASVTVTPVGSMFFNVPAITSGTLTYVVNGVQVTKTIERQLLAYEDFSGNFSGLMSQQGTGLACNPADNIDATSATVRITQSSTALTIVTVARGDTCAYSGTYSQAGHLGNLSGTYLCTSGAVGTFDFFEMVRNASDFRATTSITPGPDCVLNGYLLGLQQPPVRHPVPQ